MAAARRVKEAGGMAKVVEQVREAVGGESGMSDSNDSGTFSGGGNGGSVPSL
ncbi:MAG TPA: hypothetical protein VGJ82_23090 [Thermoanaerobaculia bacterium]